MANIHAVVVVRSGKLAMERYFTGEDERWGDTLGSVTYGSESKHDLRSISSRSTQPTSNGWTPASAAGSAPSAACACGRATPLLTDGQWNGKQVVPESRSSRASTATACSSTAINGGSAVPQRR
jgi:hypothetical protein